jgi:uncharacterized protein (DUF58 family)
MLTSRGWWFLILILAMLALGVLGEHWTLTLLALTLLLWFLAEWFAFTLRLRLAVPNLRVRRRLKDDRGAVDTLWAGHPVEMHVEVTLPYGLGLPYVRLAERVPYGVGQVSGRIERQGALTADAPLTMDYRLRCDRPGRVRFEGVTVQLADFQGFFVHTAFLQSGQVYRVLPGLTDAQGHRPTIKRDNLLPSPGLHRHLRPGSGSELLDLRDYMPGDPPKTIAWKVSARRDKLITKEFESEVPLRCTLFIDTSHSVRVGPPGQNALARLVDVSSAVAQAAAAARDLTGVCLFDDQTVTAIMRPARSSRHLVQMLNLLADAAGQAPATGEARVGSLLPLAYSFTQEVYPQLLTADVNRVPFWLPMFWSLPTYGRDPAPVSSRLPRWVMLCLAFLPLPLIALFFFFNPELLQALLDVAVPLVSLLVPVPERVLTAIGIGLAVSVGIMYYAAVNLTTHAVSLLFARRRRFLARWRKQLAALLAERYQLGPGGIGLLLEDDEQMALHLQRFLAEHQVPYPLPYHDRRGRYLFASPGKVDVLARALLGAVGKGRDNELFVLLVDLLELIDHLDPLLRAVKVALARHHQVVVICPWPPGVPPPRGSNAAGSTPASADLQSLIRQTAVERFHRDFQEMRQAFARLGVVVVCAESGDPVRLILERLNRLRTVGLGRIP